METILVTITGSSSVRCFELYLINISKKAEFLKGREMDRHYVQANTYCLSVTVGDLNL